MADFVSLTCPSCNGKLQIGKDLERFACGYCGTEFVVNRGGGIVSLSPVVEGLKRVERGVDRTASELAIVRLNNEIPEMQAEWAKLRELRNEERSIALAGGILGPLGGTFIIAVSAGNWLGWIIGLSIIGVGILALYRLSTLDGESDKEAQLHQQITNKMDELARHHQVVKP